MTFSWKSSGSILSDCSMSSGCRQQARCDGITSTEQNVSSLFREPISKIELLDMRKTSLVRDMIDILRLHKLDTRRFFYVASTPMTKLATSTWLFRRTRSVAKRIQGARFGHNPARRRFETREQRSKTDRSRASSRESVDLSEFILCTFSRIPTLPILPAT